MHAPASSVTGRPLSTDHARRVLCAFRGDYAIVDLGTPYTMPYESRMTTDARKPQLSDLAVVVDPDHDDVAVAVQPIGWHSTARTVTRSRFEPPSGSSLRHPACARWSLDPSVWAAICHLQRSGARRSGQ